MKSPVFTISGRDPSDRSRVKPHQGGHPLLLLLLLLLLLIGAVSSHTKVVSHSDQGLGFR